MESPLVVGYDGGARSLDALALAAVLGPLVGAEPLAVTVAGHDAEAPGLPEERGFEQRVVRGDSPARALDELARAEGSELIVLGSTHRGALGRVYPGSVAERLLAGGPCAVAIAPRGYADQPTDRVRVIEVGFSATPESREALRWAERIATAAGATMRILATFETGADAPGPMAIQARDELAADLRQAEDRIPDEVRPLARLVDGNPAAVLVDEAEAGVDLLVLGSRGYGPLAAALLGGVSARVMRSAPCPVLVVPRPAQADA